jgi:hypothetical protein
MVLANQAFLACNWAHACVATLAEIGFLYGTNNVLIK